MDWPMVSSTKSSRSVSYLLFSSGQSTKNCLISDTLSSFGCRRISLPSGANWRE